ncbi:hypothetical protein EVG20_g8276 [Dentipellis fragilis]|uniref:Uncharacterized protein n=1 Tax=Dentipellis fragilis TaxID=205917 RepID=A0A4Y9YB84_9AGAM|nr:hypothetical protein EVG20_g8276 [Dentipellis fragilis]
MPVTGLEAVAAKGTLHLGEAIAESIIKAATRHIPKVQVKRGDIYMRRSLDLSFEEKDFLPEPFQRQILLSYESAEKARHDFESAQGIRQNVATAHKFKKQAKAAWVITESLSNQWRRHITFAKAMAAKAVKELEAKEDFMSLLTEADKKAVYEKVKQGVINSISEPSELFPASPSYASLANMTAVVQEQWASSSSEP